MECTSKILGWIVFANMFSCCYVCAQGNVEAKNANSIEGKWIIESVQSSLWTISPAMESKVSVSFNGAFSRFAFVEEKQFTELSLNFGERKITKASNTAESRLVVMSCEIVIDPKATPATIDFQVELSPPTTKTGTSKNTKTSLKGIYAFKDEKLIILVGKKSNRPNDIDDKNIKYRVTCIHQSDAASTPR